MASPLTAPLLAALRSHQRSPRFLVKVEITSPSALTLYLATDQTTTPDGRTWSLGIADAMISHRTEFLASTVPLATLSFTLLNLIPPQLGSVAKTLPQSLAAYRWAGATVTAYLWETSLATGPEQAFKGKVLPQLELDSLSPRIYCQQRTDWNLQLPATEVSKDANPRAPERYQGLPVPICYGNLRDAPARSPAQEYDTNGFVQFRPYVAAGFRAMRGVVTRVGRGNAGEKSRILFASHACKTFFDSDKACRIFLEHTDRLCPVLPKSGADFNGAAGAGFDVDDVTSGGVEPFNAYFPRMAQDVVLVAANNAESPRSGLDGFNDTSYAHLDYDANLREVSFKLPKIGAPGTGLAAYTILGYRTSPGATHIRVDVSDSGGGGVDTFTPAASTALKGMFDLYNIHTNSFDYEVTIRVYFTGVATGETCDVFYVGMADEFRPNWSLVTPQWIVVAETNEGRPQAKIVDTPPLGFGPAQRVETGRRIARLDGSFFSTLDGYADDGSGTYTGVASALIERVPDVLRHFLITYCAQSSGNIETGASTFGSLVKARDGLKTWAGLDMAMALSLSEFAQASDWLAIMAQAALAFPCISRFDDKWRLHVWKAGAAVDYDLTFKATHGDVMDPAGPRCSTTEHVNDLEVLYGWDDWTRRSVFATHASHSRSRSGWKYRDLRDEYLTVVTNANDKLDWTDDAGAHTATLAAGDYSDATIIEEVRSKMNAISASHSVALGGRVVTGTNDTVQAWDGGVISFALAAGLYTMEALATAVKDGLNNVSSSWDCTYSRTTRKFTISRSVPNKELRWTLSTSAAALLGYSIKTYSGGGPYVSDFEVEEERFIITTGRSSFALNPETGANGINAATPKQAWGLLGYDPVRDLSGALGYTGHSVKNNREQTLALSATRYGKTRRKTIELKAVGATDSAREVRNRLIGLLAEPRVQIAFRTERAPDMELGRVIQFDASVDGLKPYPGAGSDGSWAGKKFQVLEVHQNCGNLWDQEIVAVEIS